MLRLAFKQAGRVVPSMATTRRQVERVFHASGFLLKDKPYNPNSGTSTPRKSKFAKKVEVPVEEDEEDDDLEGGSDEEDGEAEEGSEASKKGASGKSEEEKRKLEEKRKERELKKKETRLKQLDIQKKRNEAKKPKKVKPSQDDDL